MEIVIPPRDHGRSTYKYEWDENGEVVSTQRVSDSFGGSRGRGRQTVQWPFQSIVITEASVSTPKLPHFPAFRRATWQPRGIIKDDEDDDDLVDIPDYVINYIRGETPESVARRKRNGGKIAEREVDFDHARRHHQHQQSRVAQLDGGGGFLEDGMRSRSMTSRGGSSADHMLPGGDKNKKPAKGLRSLTHGWRGGVAINVLLAFSILVVAIVALILAVSRSQSQVSGSGSGENVLYAGSCATAQSIDWVAHALIAVMVVVLVAGANYVFQVLSSPTRSEVTAAHEARKWLDIGIPSVRNLAYISRSRVILSIILLVAAVITQIIYNSVILTSQFGVSYNALLVTPSFLVGAPFSNATSNNGGMLSRIQILSLQEMAVRNQLVNLTASDCRKEFAGPFNTNFKSLLIITTATTTTTDDDGSSSSSSSPGSSLLQTGGAGVISDASSSIQFCQAQPRSAADDDGNDSLTCSVSVNATLLGIVALLNLFTLIGTATALARSSRFRPLVTLGDAAASFLADPDPHTRHACLLTKADVAQHRWGLQEPKSWTPQRDHVWFRSASLARWLLTAGLWWVLVGLAAGALAAAAHASPDAHRLTAFGQLTAPAAYALPVGGASSSPISATLLAALPQAALAALYLATNSLVSTFFLSHESSLYATISGRKPRPLRVSASPAGAQTTSLYLTLPRPWSWCLLALFAAMGFVLSQSIRAVSIHTDVYLSSSSTTLTAAASSSSSSSSSSGASAGTTTLAVGFSGVGLVTLLALLVALAIVVLGLAFRRAPPAVLVNGEAVGNPLALPGGSCSAVISARCHRAPTENDAWLRPVAWGVVGQDRELGVGRCAYSARRVGQLDVAKSYA